MLSRFISKPSNHHLRFTSLLISSQPHHANHPQHPYHSPQNPSFPNPSFSSLRHFIKHFSTNNRNNNGNDGSWNISSDIEDSTSFGGILDNGVAKNDNGNGNDLFKVGGTVRKAGLVSEDWVNDKEDGEFDLFKGVEESGEEVGNAGLVNEDWVNEKEENVGFDLFKGVEESFKGVRKTGLGNEDWVNEKEEDDGFDLFKGVEGSVKEVRKAGLVSEDWVNDKEEDEGFDLFKGVEQSVKEVEGDDGWATADVYKMWDLESEEKGENVFGLGGTEMGVGVGVGVEGEVGDEESEKRKEEKMLLEKEEKELTVVFKGPDRAFGDLVAKSGITEEMLESLIALKDLEGIQGLPPLSEIEDIRYEKNTRKSSRADIERQKQEEVANARVRQVDSKGRAYGTGKRKCSIARVWIQPGEGKFVVNDKQFDVYFPMLDQRAALLRPFTETKTLGLWDVNCTVKGGGISGQVGAIRLGISRALQNWEPDLRPPLKEAGFLTRDSRIVERKKPGKAKARKSFQWVKR